MSRILLLVLLLEAAIPLFAGIIHREGEPLHVECHDSNECPLEHCCVLGPARYSMPYCSRMQEKDEVCRPSGALSMLNTTLYYPNDTKITITNVHFILCPCNHGLSCDSAEGVCRNSDSKGSSNHMIDQVATSED